MIIPDGKIQKVQSYIKRLYSLKPESNALQFICPALAEIVYADFYGLLLFPNKLSKDPLFYTNNSSSFITAYNEYLGNLDPFISYMITKGNKPAIYHNIVTPEMYKKSIFLNETDKIRGIPARDGCYLPLIIDKSLAGLIAFGRFVDYPDDYGREEMRLLAFLISFIPSGMERALSEPPPGPATALINGFGDVVDAGDEMMHVLKDIFGERYWNSPRLHDSENGTMYKNMVEGMLSGLPCIGDGEIELTTGEKEWKILFRYLSHPDQTYRPYFPEKPQLSATINRNGFVKEFLDLETAFKRYSISFREKEVIRLLFQGLSNRDIGNELKIAEGTVKHHLYNIFNKTGVDSRTHLISLLSLG